MTEEDELLTLTAVAAETGYTSARLRQLAKKGELPAKLYGKTWLVRRSALDRFKAEHNPTVGRPRGSKNRTKPPVPFRYEMAGDIATSRRIAEGKPAPG